MYLSMLYLHHLRKGTTGPSPFTVFFEDLPFDKLEKFGT